MQFSMILASSAATILGSNTRLRVKKQSRAGKDYIAIRPSFRCKKTNHMVRVVAHEHEGEQCQAVHFSAAFLESASCKAVEPGQYYLRDVGYGWYLIAEIPEGADVNDLVLVDLIDHCAPENYEDSTTRSQDDKDEPVAKNSEDDEASDEHTDAAAVSLRTFQFPAMAPAQMATTEEQVQEQANDDLVEAVA